MLAQRLRRQVFSNGKCSSAAAHASAVNFVNARPSCSGFCVEQLFQVENRLVVAEKTVLYLLDLFVSIQNLYEFVTYLRILGESWGIINFLK